MWLNHVESISSHERKDTSILEGLPKGESTGFHSVPMFFLSNHFMQGNPRPIDVHGFLSLVGHYSWSHGKLNLFIRRSWDTLWK